MVAGPTDNLRSKQYKNLQLMKPILYRSLIWFLHHFEFTIHVLGLNRLWKVAYDLEPARWHHYQRIFADEPAVTVHYVIEELRHAGLSRDCIRHITPFEDPSVAWDIEIFCDNRQLDDLTVPGLPF